MPFFSSRQGVLVAHQLGVYTVAQTVKGQLLYLPNSNSTIMGNADMHICFTQGFGHGATPFASQCDDGHVTFVRGMQGAHQTFFFTCGREQQQHIAGLTQSAHLPG
jgi:hypothetical protein